MTELEIKSLLVRERYYRDTEQWTKLRSSYHPDPARTSINISWFHGDIDGFVAGSKRMAQSRARPIHTISPAEVHLRDDKAVSESTGSIIVRFEHNGVEYDCTSYTRFISRLKRVEGHWKLLSLEAIYDRDMIQAVKPEGMQNALVIDAEARSSYQCLTWLLSQSGFEINQSLPGVDLPGSGEELVKLCLDWLNSES
ncbi:hypothetical protein GQ53DRAFT_633207 [Thozetella sp. PMI_491]|nr:hypothetical protein GQ53DRAFT_633207 [Thozetella sp. PMI_491]